MKTLIATLFILFVVSMPVHAESEFKYWETSTYTNEATNQIEKRLVYILPKKPRRLGPNYVFFTVPCDTNKPISIEISSVILSTNHYYRPEWYHPRGKINVRLDKKWVEWEAIRPEGSFWLYLTMPSTTQIVQQLKDHGSLRLHIKFAINSKYKIDIKSTNEFGKLYDSHCG